MLKIKMEKVIETTLSVDSEKGVSIVTFMGLVTLTPLEETKWHGGEPRNGWHWVNKLWGEHYKLVSVQRMPMVCYFQWALFIQLFPTHLFVLLQHRERLLKYSTCFWAQVSC